MGFWDFLKQTTIPNQKWVDLIYPGAHAEKVTIAELKKISAVKIENCNRIINDSVRIMRTTTKPDTFFTRLRILIEQIEYLVSLEPYLKFSGQKPSELKSILDSSFEETVERFLSQCFKELSNYMEENHTAKTKQNRIKKFSSLFIMYDDMIPSSLQQLYTSKLIELENDFLSKS